jgi:GNAT superfamily N-acetyltransferase
MIKIKRTTNMALIKELDAQLFGTEVLPPREKNHVWWVAYVDGEVAGYAGLGIYKGENYGFLHRAGVLKGFRGKGLQRRFIKVREKEARAQGLKVMLTYTANWNLKSANNLIGSGYKLYRPENPFGCTDSLYFWKDL